MASVGAAKVPGPGAHSPDFKTDKRASPRYGFGSEKRNNTAVER